MAMTTSFRNQKTCSMP